MKRRLSTRCVHAGEQPGTSGAPFTPIHNSTTFRFADTQSLLDVIEGRREGGLYTRYGYNPSIRSTEAKLAAVEGAEAALLFSAGMGAASALFFAHGQRGILYLGDAYGGTLELLEDQLGQLGLRSQGLLGHELDQLDAALGAGVGLVFLETPTNPRMELFDIAAIAERAHAHGALLAVDGTFATPVNQRPLELGADLVMHSATKFLGGHSDLTAGVLCGAAPLLEAVVPWRKNLGQVPAPETAALLSRSLRTLPVRVRQQNANAQAVAEALQGHPAVAKVLYPGLSDFPQHALARRQMRGFGAMITLELHGGAEAAVTTLDRLTLIANAPSLGGVESLATLPMITTHHGMNPAERARRGIHEGMMRLSIGLEDPADLIADLEQALAKASCLVEPGP
ncbi:trans-sulfuration enzyme family protein [Alkalilimnicola sp. S0819]|uniref:trans-sulfuration enzyme family protein n=1 Tax=Alkalilimnicola sp. S0819 TaxID=2613922 RepID=UPI001261F729|nr:aminotransferase class I/II-fold pyridoxal phosphate-dependent enzyme [Alkalilimnicola sp. S0819]KAB7627271.1 aminotransferase class I/II-fold pyridoxal phosphate-dependent enzyme [Alkalilimnicola sp. S0819]MPQ15984.1 aminotransferase class V-fold PLP-dependent enzyme [Alkalilimnicola sp. S0819]